MIHNYTNKDSEIINIMDQYFSDKICFLDHYNSEISWLIAILAIAITVLTVGVPIYNYIRSKNINNILRDQEEKINEFISKKKGEITSFQKEILEQIKNATDQINKGINENENKIKLSKIKNIPSANLNIKEKEILAQAYILSNNWRDASNIIEEIITENDSNWLYFYDLGRSYANLRDINLTSKAIKSYFSAISLLIKPSDINKKGEIYILIGALYKRLYNFEEAISYINLGLFFAEKDETISDAKYNLICISAMQKDNTKFKDLLSSLNELSEEIEGLTLEKLRFRLKYYAPEYVDKL